MTTIREHYHASSLQAYISTRGSFMFLAAQSSLVLNIGKETFLDHSIHTLASAYPDEVAGAGTFLMSE